MFIDASVFDPTFGKNEARRTSSLRLYRFSLTKFL